MRCPNCGAPGQSGVCEYCDVPLVEDEETVQHVVVEHYHFNAEDSRDPFVSTKSRLVATLLCFFLGVFGAHRFYAGKYLTAILMLVTFGGFGLWWFVDLIMAVCGKLRDGQGRYISDWKA